MHDNTSKQSASAACPVSCDGHLSHDGVCADDFVQAQGCMLEAYVMHATCAACAAITISVVNIDMSKSLTAHEIGMHGQGN